MSPEEGDTAREEEDHRGAIQVKGAWKSLEEMVRERIQATIEPQISAAPAINDVEALPCP